MEHVIKLFLIFLFFLLPLNAQDSNLKIINIEKRYTKLLNKLNTDLGYYLSSYQTELITNEIITIMEKNDFDKIILEDSEINEFHNFIKIENKIFYNQSKSKIEYHNKLTKIEKTIFYNNKKIGKLYIYLSHKNKIPKLNLTEEEKLWLKNNPIIKLAVMSYWTNNEELDFHKEILKLINKYASTNIIPVTFDVWSEGYKKATEGKDINGIMGLSYSKQREKEYFYYSPSYDFTPAYLIVKNDSNIYSINDLKDKTIYLKKDSITHKFVESKLSNTKTIDKRTIQDMYKDITTKNEADAILSYFVDQNDVEKYNLKIVDKVYDKYGEVSIGINHNFPLLSSIINKTLKIIPQNEIDEIRDNSGLNLTNKEKSWLSKKIPIKYVYDPDWKPFEYINELNEHDGIIADLIKLIQYKSEIVFTPINSKNWNDAISKVKDSQAVMYSGVGETKERKEYMNFTKHNLYTIPYVFLTKKGIEYINGFDDIKDNKVIVVENYAIEKILKEQKPYINLISVENIKKGIKELRANKADVMIINLASAKYYINILGYSDLKLSYKTNYHLNIKIAIRKDFSPEALSIIDKTIKNINKKDLDDILYKWTEAVIRDKTDWSFIVKIVGLISIISLFLYLNNRKLKSLVKTKTEDIQKQSENIKEQKEDLENLLNSFDNNVIFTKTDLKGTITHASEAFCILSGYSKKELIGKSHNIFKHPDTKNETYTILWEALKNNTSIILEMKNLRKDGTYYWVEGKFEPDYNKDGELIGYYSIRQDITSKKEVQQLSLTLENKVKERTVALDKAKQQIESILENILLPVLITSKNSRKIVYANRFAEKQYETKLEDIIGSSIEKLYTINDQNEEIIKQLKEKGIVENLEQKFKTHTGKEFTALLSVTPIVYNDDEAYIGMVTDITKQKEIEEKIREIHKQTKDSIEYASIIQHSLIPEKAILDNYFKEHLTIWQPKDIVGGDIYLIEPINDNEIIIMVIDCTGHGVPGAFVTMLVKAIERQVIAIINNNSFIEISPAWILSYFNQTIKSLLKQTNTQARSNAGFDGGVLYYNKDEKIIKYAGSNTPLFYTDKNNTLHTIKGDRHSVGYKKSDINYIFKDTTIEIDEGMRFYLSTDGYFDQNGGTKGFPLGKKAFINIIKKENEPLETQKESLIKKLLEYQKDEDRNDDITIVGIKI